MSIFHILSPFKLFIIVLLFGTVGFIVWQEFYFKNYIEHAACNTKLVKQASELIDPEFISGGSVRGYDSPEKFGISLSTTPSKNGVTLTLDNRFPTQTMIRKQKLAIKTEVGWEKIQNQNTTCTETDRTTDALRPSTFRTDTYQIHTVITQCSNAVTKTQYLPHGTYLVYFEIDQLGSMIIGKEICL